MPKSSCQDIKWIGCLTIIQSGYPACMHCCIVYFGTVEANCIRHPVSLSFTHSETRKRGGNNKETSLDKLASDTKISHTISIIPGG